jgi:hypothetical protein
MTPEINAPHEPRRREVLLAALAMLGGCGGGVDSGGTGTGAASTYANGPILGFGSIIVNGVRFDDSNARIDNDDGLPLSRAELALGMRTEILASAVTTVGGVASATAATIRVQREIVGPLERVNAPAAELVVLGQTVAVVAATVLDASIAGGLGSLVAGDIIEVFAALDLAAGRYVASRIGRRAGASSYILRGAVTSLSLTAKTLKIGQLTIDWSAVAPSDPASALSPGRLLRVKLAPGPVNGLWHATALSSGQPMPADRAFAEVEGRITAFTSPTAFALDGLPVDATTATFPAGSAGLALGAEVEVSGSVRNGVLVATRVELEDETEGGGTGVFELHGSIESVDASASRFVVRSVVVVWNQSTLFEGGSAADIKVGRVIEVKGRLSANGQQIEAVAIHIES